MSVLVRSSPRDEGGGMNCSKCGASAIGLVNGIPFCHRKECVDWKAQRWVAQQARELEVREIVMRARAA